MLNKKMDRMLNKRTTKADKMPKIFEDSTIQFNGYPMICSDVKYNSILVEYEKDSFDDEQDEINMTNEERNAYDVYIKALKNYSGEKVCGVTGKTRRW